MWLSDKEFYEVIEDDSERARYIEIEQKTDDEESDVKFRRIHCNMCLCLHTMYCIIFPLVNNRLLKIMRNSRPVLVPSPLP